MKLKQILTAKQLDDFEKQNEARLILKMLSEKGTPNHHVKLIKRLYFYLDLDLVKEGLIEIYRNTDSIVLKEAIADLHDGDLDMEDYLLALEQRDEIEAFAQELDNEYELESSNADSQPISNLKRTFKKN